MDIGGWKAEFQHQHRRGSRITQELEFGEARKTEKSLSAERQAVQKGTSHPRLHCPRSVHGTFKSKTISIFEGQQKDTIHDSLMISMTVMGVAAH